MKRFLGCVVRFRTIYLVFLVLVAKAIALQPDNPTPKPAVVTTLQAACPNSANLFSSGLGFRSLDRPWQQDYPMLILSKDPNQAQLVIDASATAKQDQDKADKAKSALAAATDNNRAELQQAADDALKQSKISTRYYQLLRDAHQIYWREPKSPDLTPIPDHTFVGNVFTTEKVLVLLCNLTPDDSTDIAPTTQVVNGADTQIDSQKLSIPQPILTRDRIYLLPAAKGNDVTSVAFGPSKDKDGNTQVPVATTLLERHRVIHFSAGGGLLLTRARSVAYTVNSVTATTTTTTTISTTDQNNQPHSS